MVCPRCGQAEPRKNGTDRRGTQVYECTLCARTFTSLTDSPFSGFRFPPDVIALAVRYYLRYRLSYAVMWTSARQMYLSRGTRHGKESPTCRSTRNVLLTAVSRSLP